MASTSCSSVTDSASAAPARLAAKLLAWFERHGRHDLPWQRDVSPYRVWVSEIMLQQTQVATVIPYYERFMARFPGIAALADAGEDEVLHHWSGLGYYTRARNLHRAARLLRDQYAGDFPREADAIEALPGVGRSTAGAIRALALGERAAILDGNVRRVLSRLFAIEGAPTAADTQRSLWALAESMTPTENCAAYTQAIMDLGATVCTRTRPACALCPFAEDCRARAMGNPTGYPGRKARKAVPTRRRRLLVIRNGAGEFLLEKRPTSGIWGGLWSFPETGELDDPALACDRIAGEAPSGLRHGTPIQHSFSHFRLEAEPVYLRVAGTRAGLMEDQRLAWYKPGSSALGLAAPVMRLIEALHAASAEPEGELQ